MIDIQDVPDEWECRSCLDVVRGRPDCPGCAVKTNVNREGPARLIEYGKWAMCEECGCEGGEETFVEGEGWEPVPEEKEWVPCTKCGGVGAVPKGEEQ